MVNETMSPHFLANFGAEERDVLPPSSWGTPTLHNLEQAWRQVIGTERAHLVPPGAEVVVAWFNSHEAARFAARRGCALHGAPPDIVAAVHDKAFATRVVQRHGFLPPALSAAIRVVDAHDIEAVDLLTWAAAAAKSATAAGVLHRGFTAKPRHSTSGRGRVDLRAMNAVAGATARLRQRGGCIVEPWLVRTRDLASAWLVDDDGAVRFCGSSRAVVNAAGVWQASEVTIDEHGVPRAPEPSWEPVLVEQSRAVVEAASAFGYHGPCGVDAFVFVDTDGCESLRVVELNARFTAGLVAVALAVGKPPSSRWRFCPRESEALSQLHDTPTASPAE
jgi:hypothetical protein